MKHTRSCLITLALFVSCLMSTSALAANSVDVINYQGRLTDSEGTPVADGAHEALVEIFDTPTPTQGQNPLWNSARDLTLHVSEGVFSVELGSDEPFPAGLFDEYDDLYLRITVENEQLTPLQHMTSTPYAMKAETADHAHTATTAANVVDGTVTGDLFVDGSIGINISTPGAGLHVVQTEDEDAFRVDDYDSDITPFVIDGSGSVGIGTTSPEAKLHVIMPHGIPTIPPVPSTVKGVVIKDGTLNAANQLEIQDDSGAARFVVDTGGKVGIGTEVPKGNLHVVGDTYAEGHIYLYAREGDGSSGTAYIQARDKSGTSSIAMQLRTQKDGDINNALHIDEDGRVGIGITSPTALLTVNGRTKTDVLEITGGADFAERFDIRGVKEDLSPSPGMTVGIDPESPGNLMVTSKAYDKKVAGIISGAGGVKPGMLMGQENSKVNGSNPVALTGRVYCWADTTNGPIAPGDLLTTSDTPGHAMKVKDYERAQGAILGKAMTGLDEKAGLVLVLVTLQ